MNKTAGSSLAAFILINGLFICKYLAGTPIPVGFVVLLYVTGIVLLICFANRIPANYFRKPWRLGLLVLYTIVALVLLASIKIQSLDVDRWSVIVSFWDTLFDGRFPYLARSIHGNPPGPLPFYFVLALPFYLIGGIGLMPLLAILALAPYLRLRRAPESATAITLLLAISAPALLWELCTRSTLLFNMLLILFYLQWLERSKAKTNPAQFGIGLVGGLLLSTRAIVAVPILAFFVFKYRNTRSWQEFIVRGTGLIAGLSLTLLPLCIWDWPAFKVNNPFFLQAGFLNLPLLIITVAIAVFIGFTACNTTQLLRYTGLLLVAVVTAAFIKTILQYGWTTSFYNSAFDISYYILAIPLLLTDWYTAEEKISGV